MWYLRTDSLLPLSVLLLLHFYVLQVSCVPALHSPGNHHLHQQHLRHNTRCSRCPPGWGVVERCTPQADTLCQPCSSGTYSPHSSALAGCWVCARCGNGLYEAHPCTRRADTICDRCATIRGPHNGDFSAHCNGTLPDVTDPEVLELTENLEAALASDPALSVLSSQRSPPHEAEERVHSDPQVTRMVSALSLPHPTAAELIHDPQKTSSTPGGARAAAPGWLVLLMVGSVSGAIGALLAWRRIQRSRGRLRGDEMEAYQDESLLQELRPLGEGGGSSLEHEVEEESAADYELPVLVHSKYPHPAPHLLNARNDSIEL